MIGSRGRAGLGAGLGTGLGADLYTDWGENCPGTAAADLWR
jgi:hypothetical protein